jgi:hypothetical protein
MKFGRSFYCLLLLGMLLVLTTSIALAWPDGPPERVTISGPGLTGEVEVTDKEILTALSLGAIEDFERGPITAPKVGEGYQITRYFYEASFNFGRLHYYPNPAGERSYIFFEDGPDFIGDHTIYDGKWFYTTSQGEAAMQRLLKSLDALAPASTRPAAANVSVQLAPENKQPDAVNRNIPSPVAVENFDWPPIGFIIPGVCVLVLVGVLYFRRQSLDKFGPSRWVRKTGEADRPLPSNNRSTEIEQT